MDLTKLSEKEQQLALNEIRILASIKHPNIISYKDTFVVPEENMLYMVLEHASLGDLHDMIQLFRSKY